MANRRDILAFYVGVIVGVVGNLLASTIVEIVNNIFKGMNASGEIIIAYWGFMFAVTSVLFFGLIKWALRRLEVEERELRAFDIGIVVCVLVGIFVIVYAIIRF